jgi:hypothetical protein
MVVVRHLAECMDDEIETLANNAHRVEPGTSIPVIIKDGRLAVATRRDVI